MGQTRVFRHSFAGGEVSPELEARLDDSRHQQGLATCQNMLVQPQGYLERRRGSEFGAEAANPAAESRMITFAFSADEQLGIEIAAGKFRFHVDGAPVLAAETGFVLTKAVASVNITPGVMQCNFSGAHGIATGDGITFGFAPGGSMIGGLSLFVVYFAIAVDATHLQVAATREQALAGQFLDFSGTGGSLFVHRVYEVGESFGYPTAGGTPYICTVRSLAGYVPIGSPAVTATFATGTNLVTSVGHGFFQGAPVIFALNGGTLPPEVTAGVVYYVLPVTVDTYQISATYGSGPAVPFSVASTGSPTVVRQTLFVSPPGGIYEVPNSYAQADLMAIKHAQSNDVVKLQHPNYPEADLRRLSANHWTFGASTYGPNIAVPTIAVVDAPVEGAGVTVAAAADIGSPSQINFGTDGTDHNFAGGQVVRWTGGGTIEDSGSNIFDGNGDLFVVGIATSASQFVIRTFENAARVSLPNAGPYTVNGTVTFRPTSLLSLQDHKYKVTAIDSGSRETLPSAEVSITNDLDVEGAQNSFSWHAVAGAERYRVYKLRNGLLGFLGEVEHAAGQATFSFIDDNTLQVDLGLTAPRQDASLGTGDHARCSAFFEERLMLGGTRSRPQVLFGTRTGTDGDMTFHIPVQDTDRIEKEIAAAERLTIRHLVPLGDLLVLTSSGEWRVTSDSRGAVTPESITARQQSSVGCSDVTPVIVSNSVLFAGAFDGHLYELGFSEQAGGYVPGDVCLRATHLFDDFTIRDLGYAKVRVKSAWVCSSSGKLLGLSYLPAEQVGAWHRHDTLGSFRSVCVVTEGGYDSLYLCVRRTIGGVEVHYIERIRLLPRPKTLADSFYVDSGLSFTNGTGSPVTVISGLDHLIGQTVTALVDGSVQSGKVVNGSGEITLSPALQPGKTAHIGLPTVAELETLPATLNSDGGYGQSRTKNVTHVALKVLGSARFDIGPTAALLTKSGEIAPGEIKDGLVRVLAVGKFTDGGQLLVRQADPLPLNVVALVIELTYGGG